METAPVFVPDELEDDAGEGAVPPDLPIPQAVAIPIRSMVYRTTASRVVDGRAFALGCLALCGEVSIANTDEEYALRRDVSATRYVYQDWQCIANTLTPASLP